ncbi:SPFH domain-containing protein [Bulleidia sp. zg-1006]|uniref:SPFH domain-containing protein n=1 Tax=Bulleidia sp. zg-1006 TaxID=2806552 RepID=UPI00193964E7|nr:SPFH domain-containing protein [Bulleidia sp. zg-1006]QRG86562.1 SPFH/Band 7/PHB domain protein [Bulleidia sp. zg-1006]
MPIFVYWIVVFMLVLAILVSTLNVVPQEHAYVIERLGRYHTTWDAGIHIKVPLIDRIAKRMLLKEQVADFAPQPVITKDNVTMQIDSVVYFKVFSPHQYAYGVENPIMAMENLTATTLRNIIGDMELDQTLTSREAINSQMLQTIDLATDPWGIKITRVELKNIQPPAAIRESMEKQMKAEREKRAAILTAEGEKQAMILAAEGNKESAVLNAEAKKQATILAAEAEREKEIKEAEGRAEAIRAIQQATAEGLKAIKEAGADETVIKLKSLEAFAQAANGQATKIIIPSEIQGIAGLAKGVFETIKEEKSK